MAMPYITALEEVKWHTDGEAAVVTAVNRTVGEGFLRRGLIVVDINNSRTGILESGRIRTGGSPRSG